MGEFINEEIEQYIHKFYMRDVMMLMALSMEMTYNTCVFMKDVNKEAKILANGKTIDATFLIANGEQLTWNKLSNKNFKKIG